MHSLLRIANILNANKKKLRNQFVIVWHHEIATMKKLTKTKTRFYLKVWRLRFRK